MRSCGRIARAVIFVTEWLYVRRGIIANGVETVEHILASTDESLCFLTSARSSVWSEIARSGRAEPRAAPACSRRA